MAEKKPEVFLGGETKTDWREDIIKEFKDTLKLIDPVDPDWDPSQNIYEELTNALNADEVVFFKGGEGSKGEQSVLDAADKDYKIFTDLDELATHLERLSNISLPIKKGDDILTGHWKNHKEKVKTIGEDKYGQPTINSRPLLRMRIPKLMPDKKTKASIDLIASVLKTADYDHGCIMAPAPEELRTHILKELVPQIPEQNLATDKDETLNGVEVSSHVTVLWGIETTEKDMETIRNHFTALLTIKSLPTIKYFDNEETAAYLPVESADLTKLHNVLKRELPNVDDHDEYVPHITIAYLEKGKRLDITDITPFEWKVTKLIISKPDGTTEDIYAKGYEPEHEAVEVISSVLKENR